MSYSKLSILKPGQTFSIGDAVFILLEHGKSISYQECLDYSAGYDGTTV